jgi:hypothetical protein
MRQFDFSLGGCGAALSGASSGGLSRWIIAPQALGGGGFCTPWGPIRNWLSKVLIHSKTPRTDISSCSKTIVYRYR